MELFIDESRAGKTVKALLYGELSLSHSLVTRLKKTEDGITVDGQKRFVTYVLQPGQTLCLRTDDREDNPALVSSDRPVCVLYEDDDLLAVDKPPCMPTHPSLHHYDDTLANALAGYFRRKGRPFVFRGVNRLDRDTSGVVLVAKNKRVSALLAQQISSRGMQKGYLALLAGTLEKKSGFIEKNVMRKSESLIERCVSDTQGQSALTEYTVLQERNGLSLVYALPHTGRTHQLRVHFAYAGAPILGDTLYGQASDIIARQALHACTLRFTHPVTGAPVRIAAPLPDDMAAVLKENGFESIFLEDL